MLALLIAFVAWVLGPRPRQRTCATGGTGCCVPAPTPDSGAEPSPVATFVARSKGWLRGLGVALAFVVLIVWNHPTALTVLGIAVLLLVYLAILELLSRSAAPATVTDTT